MTRVIPDVAKTHLIHLKWICAQHLKISGYSNNMAVGKYPVPRVDIPKMTKLVFVGIFTYPILGG